MIGSDPEFAFSDGLKLIPAYQLLHSPRALRDMIGLDGKISTAEVRPAASRSYMEHFNNIFLAKAQVQNICNIYGINALAPPFYRTESLGGHIHISSTDISTEKLVEYGIKIQYLLLPAMNYIWGKSAYNRIVKSNFRYGSPYDIRIQGQRHVELRMLPTFLGLNDGNVINLLRFYFEAYTYLAHNDLKLKIYKPDINNIMPFYPDEMKSYRGFLAESDRIYKFVYQNKIGFAIKFYRSINQYNTFILAKRNDITTKIPKFYGVVYFLS
ncbi:MAG: hypothetical protein QW134_08945, partial [Nitrososphaeria archaeon]